MLTVDHNRHRFHCSSKPWCTTHHCMATFQGFLFTFLIRMMKLISFEAQHFLHMVGLRHTILDKSDYILSTGKGTRGYCRSGNPTRCAEPCSKKIFSNHAAAYGFVAASSVEISICDMERWVKILKKHKRVVYFWIGSSLRFGNEAKIRNLYSRIIRLIESQRNWS